MTPSTTAALATAPRATARRLDRPLRVVAGGNASVPWTLLRVLEETVDEVELFMLNAPWRSAQDRTRGLVEAGLNPAG
ncbi:hypothetical protein ACOCJ5_16650 [Knoellia sp. CPCC 206450]|uniref:hypothetical protein n=1 Tax=Knoellia tibetensis TaxID=3404798 RepID=UPI003B42B070